MEDAEVEIRRGDRFAFGANWGQFVALVDEDRVAAAVASLRTMLSAPDLQGLRFVDIGCGSGLFSLAAHRLGANVTSFDYDPESVKCTQELRRQFVGETDRWMILSGSALDDEFIRGLGTFDVVYSWGVLHHTGDLWRAIRNVSTLTRSGGYLFISIYNDQGRRSRIWRRIKRRYNASKPIERRAILAGVTAYFHVKGRLPKLYCWVRRIPQPPRPSRDRGMDRRRDMLDWVGGYPFEVAKPEEVFDAFTASGYVLERLKTCGGGIGCNEFVFRRT